MSKRPLKPINHRTRAVLVAAAGSGDTDRSSRFVGSPDDYWINGINPRPPNSGITIDAGGGDTAMVKDGEWISSTEPALLEVLKLRQQHTRLTDNNSLAADARLYLGINAANDTNEQEST